MITLFFGKGFITATNILFLWTLAHTNKQNDTLKHFRYQSNGIYRKQSQSTRSPTRPYESIANIQVPETPGDPQISIVCDFTVLAEKVDPYNPRQVVIMLWLTGLNGFSHLFVTRWALFFVLSSCREVKGREKYFAECILMTSFSWD